MRTSGHDLHVTEKLAARQQGGVQNKNLAKLQQGCCTDSALPAITWFSSTPSMASNSPLDHLLTSHLAPPSLKMRRGCCFSPTLMFLAAATSRPRLKHISWKFSFLIFLFFNFISAGSRGAFVWKQAALSVTAINWQCLACCSKVCVCVIGSEWIMLTFWIFDQEGTCLVLLGELVLFALHEARFLEQDNNFYSHLRCCWLFHQERNQCEVEIMQPQHKGPSVNL